MRASLLTLLALLWVGCERTPDAPTSDSAPGATSSGVSDSARVLQDDVGRTVRVPAQPQRVVSLAPSVTELIVAVGGGDVLAARTPYCDHPEGVQTLPVVSTYPLDREALVATEADLVIGTDQINDPGDGDGLQPFGIAAYYLRFETLADVARGMRTVGRLLGTETRAEAAAAVFEQGITARQPTGLEVPDLLLLIGDDVLYGFGEASYVHDLVARAGARSVSATLPGEAVTLSSEWVLAQAPDVIVVLAGVDYVTADLLRAQPAWAAVPALARGRVCGLDPDLVVRPGPRLTEGIDALVVCIAG
ncbi:MAG: helical backbone metal receptor [Bacteroidota bacterium]